MRGHEHDSIKVNLKISHEDDTAETVADLCASYVYYVLIYKGDNKPKKSLDSYHSVLLLPYIFKVFQKLVYSLKNSTPSYKQSEIPPPPQQ